MVIPSRIKTIGNFVSENDVVADVGADHGLLELYLLAKYPNVKVVAIENKIGPYKILDNNLRCFRNIRLSLSDGLTAVDSTVNTVVIAGMGGLNIKKILNNHPAKCKKIDKFIIDAHRDIDVARKSIIKYGFKIEKEVLVYEQKKYYVISEFVKTKEAPIYSEDELQIGLKLYEDELWPNYRDYLIQTNNRTIEKIKDKVNMQDKVLKLQKFNERLLNYGKN